MISIKLLASLFQSVISLPISNTDSAWVAEPTERGTWGIIQSCLVTLLLCINTAVHRDIYPNKNKKDVFLRQLGWIAIALIAPEAVLEEHSINGIARGKLWNTSTACEETQQWYVLFRLSSFYRLLEPNAATDESFCRNQEGPECKRCNPRANDDTSSNSETGGEDSSIESTEASGWLKLMAGARWSHTKNAPPETFRVSDWTMGHAFFAISGGLTIDTKAFWAVPHVTLTPFAIVELARLQMLPSLPLETIKDKAKADWTAKILVCVQVGWFVIQAISRVAQKSPLSLLEIHVLAHVVVVFLVYIFWFHKPYNPQYPIIYNDGELVEMAALFLLDPMPEPLLPPRIDTTNGTFWWQCCQKDNIELLHVRLAHHYRHLSSSESIKDPHLKQSYGDEGCRTEIELDSISHHPLRRMKSEILPQATHSAERSGVPLRPVRSEGSILPHQQNRVRVDEDRLLDYEGNSHQHPYLHLRLAQKAIERLKARGLYYAWCVGKDPMETTSEVRHQGLYTIDSCGKFPIDFDYPSHGVRILSSASIVLFMLFSVLYGGFHLSAWNAHFPTTAERGMWRTCGLILVSLPVSMGVLVPLSSFSYLLLSLRSLSDYGRSNYFAT